MLHWAVRSGAVDSINTLIDKGAQINGRDDLGQTALLADALADAALACHEPLMSHLRQRQEALEGFAPNLASLRRALAARPAVAPQAAGPAAAPQ